MKHDIIIIGSGLGGLICGSLLSQLGKDVLVLEQGLHIGGCLQCYQRHQMTYDTGFHYVGGLDEGGGLRQVFESLGLMSLPWKRLDADGYDRVSIGDKTCLFKEGYDNFAEGMAAYFPHEHASLIKYANELKHSEAHQFDLLNPDSLDDVLSADLFSANAYDYLSSQFKDSNLINVLSGPSMKLELRKESLPLFTFAHVMGGYIRSSWRLQGGGEQIAELLANRIKANGGDVITQSKVIEIITHEGKAYAVRCENGEVYEASTFVSDIHPSLTCSLVKDGSMRNIYKRRVSSLANTYGMFTVSLRLKPHTLPYHNYNEYVYAIPQVWNMDTSGSVKSVMISMRVPKEGTFAEQVDLLTPMTWEECGGQVNEAHPLRSQEYEDIKARKAEGCIQLASQTLPGLSAMIEDSVVSTPLTWHDYTLTPEGSAYGIRKDSRLPLLTVLSSRTPVANLLLTGQSLMLHGIQGVSMTALMTCTEIVGKRDVWKWLHME